MPDQANRPLKVVEAANALGVSVHTIRAWISQRRLSHVRLGRAIRVLPEEVERFLNNAAVPALATLHGMRYLPEPTERIRKKDASSKSSQRQIVGEQ